jgi:CTP synthase
LKDEGFDKIALEKLALPVTDVDMTDWENMVQKLLNPTKRVKIAMVGKYVALHDAYLSVAEGLYHAGIVHDTAIDIEWIDSEEIESLDNLDGVFEGIQGILVPGGFGDRGVEGKIRAIQYARENKIPFFGLCLGMQTAVIEYARNVAGFEGANSSEFDENTKYPVIDLMEEQADVTSKGGTMRLGAYPCKVMEGTKTHAAYGADMVDERHRHRYEFNNKYLKALTDAGLVIGGTSPSGSLVEIVEVPDHPWFVATQFHPEFKSRPTNPHPLFSAFVEASLKIER